MAEHRHGTDDIVTGPKSASGNVSSTGSHSMSMGGMEMTFTGWSSYTLTLLLGSWQIKKPWQFFLTWLAVFLASILYHAIRFAICGLDCMINSTAKSNPAYIGMHDTAGAGELSNFQTSRRFARPNGWLALKLLHGLMTGCHYGLSLMLMLVSTSILVNCAYATDFQLRSDHLFDFERSGGDEHESCSHSRPLPGVRCGRHFDGRAALRLAVRVQWACSQNKLMVDEAFLSGTCRAHRGDRNISAVYSHHLRPH